jgi:hypothetical protein
MSEITYNVIAPESGVPVKAWTKGVPLADACAQAAVERRPAPVHLQVDRRNAVQRNAVLGRRPSCGLRASDIAAVTCDIFFHIVVRAGCRRRRRTFPCKSHPARVWTTGIITISR